MSEARSDQPALIRVMIVDDHPLVRDGLKVLLMTAPDMTLAAEANKGEEALQLCGTTAVDIVLMDLKMPGMGGVQATRAIRERYPQVKVIALTSFAEKALIEEALQAGATSYIVKNSSSEELAAAIRIAQAGQTTISRSAIQSLVQHEPSDSKRLGDDLTSREREVLALMVVGLSNAEIGRRLVIQSATVNFHVGHILSKLEASNRTEAAAVAVQLELIS